MTEIPIPQPSPRLDRWNRYVIGGVGHTRVTTVAKTLDDGGSLAPWKSTMSIVGLFNRRGLMAQWESLIAETDRDPWYRSKESKARCKRLVEECATAGGSTDAADVGTSLHALTAMVDRGFTTPGISPATEADLSAYVDALITYGVAIDPEHVETTLVLGGWQVAGSADRLNVRVRGFDEPMVADIKTGQDLQYSWQSIAIQLAAYANAETRYVFGATPAEDRHIGLPECSKTHALVIHLPAGKATCSLHVVDIARGWEAFKLAMHVRTWRQHHDLSTPIGAFQPIAPDAGSRARHPSNGAPPAPAPARPLSPAPELGRLRAWLQGRVDVLGDIPDARRDLVHAWPASVPPLKKADTHTLDELTAIERVLDAVEAKYSVPFGDTRPALNVIHAVFPRSTEMEEPS